MQRSADIPSTYPEALVGDDNDGNLANGTPNQCEIDAAFALHGLTDPSVTLGLLPPARDGLNVSFSVNPPGGNNPSCPPPTITSPTLSWSPSTPVNFTDIPLVATGNTYAASLLAQPDGSLVLYHVTIQLSDGSKVVYPQNPADPDYQMYVGPVTKLKCWDFEAGAADWTHSANSPSRDEWQVGPPMGIGGEPHQGLDGTNVFGIDLGSDDGQYRNNTKQWAQSADVDLQGFTAAHLQYERWLGVQDGAYDNAIIFAASSGATDMEVWSNHAS